MKKLIILAVIIMVAVATKAATFQWAGVNFYDHTGTLMAGTGSAELFVYAAEVEAFSLGTYTPNTAGKIPGSTNVFTMGADNGAGGTYPTFEVGTEYSFYLVITDADGYTLDTRDASLIQTATPIKDKNVSVTFNLKNATSIAYGTEGSYWHPSENVPEPTSGLLLLLGVAGLALRRKRA